MELQLSPDTAALLLVAAILLGAAGLVTGVAALRGQKRVRRAYAAFSMGSREDVLTLLQRHIDEVARLRSDVGGLRRYADELRERGRGAITGVGVVRYDAFDDMGGHLSFSTALLDERGDGAVITTINGRAETRVYAKPVVAGSSRHNLSAEEAAAIKEALASAGGLARTRRRSPRAPQQSADTR